MKKKIVEELHELAIHILKKNDDSDWEDLRDASRLLYEQLTVRTYMQGKSKPDASKNREENLAEPLIEKIKDMVAQMPSEGQSVDQLLEQVLPKQPSTSETPKSDLEAFAEHYKETPVFERKDSREDSRPKSEDQPEAPPRSDVEDPTKAAKKVNDIERKKSLNDKLNKGLNIGLNDRLAFTKHLFNENSDDYHRVISQISTIETLDEAQRFIDNHVAPDYNWEGKELHVNRFKELIEKKFD